MSGTPARNQVICPRCGEVKVETPPGTIVLPIARREPVTPGTTCECGKRHLDADEAPGEPSAREG